MQKHEKREEVKNDGIRRCQMMQNIKEKLVLHKSTQISHEISIKNDLEY